MKKINITIITAMLSLISFAQARIEEVAIFGGLDHGTPFSDLSTVTASEPSAILSSITIHGGARVDAISYKFAWNGLPAISHGGDGGSPNSLDLGFGEDIVTVKACADKYKSGVLAGAHTRIFYLELTTTLGNTVMAGMAQGSCMTWTAKSGMGVIGFQGRSGDEIDAIAPIWGTPDTYL